MSIEKYLNGVKTPNGHPGPIAVKLKHDIKRKLIIRRRRKEHIFIGISSLGVVMFFFAGLLLYNPDYAVAIHNNLFVRADIVELSTEDIAQAEAEKLQSEVPLSAEGRILGSHSASSFTSVPSNIRYVSTDPQASSGYQIMELSQLEEGTPYVIRKVTDRNNRIIYFVNEISNGITNNRMPY